MPLQKPTSCIISRSYWVRMRRRWASSSLPSFSNYCRRSGQLGLDADDGRLHPLVAGHVVGGREDRQLVERADLLAGERVDPVMRSTSSPNSSMRTDVSS